MIIITTPALAAAQRIRERCEVRTFQRDYVVVDVSHHDPRPERTELLRERIRALFDQGVSQRDTAEKLSVSRTTVQRHVSKIKKERGLTGRARE